MRSRATVAVLMAAATVLTGAGEAQACSIARAFANPFPPTDPRALVDDARTVFEGEVVATEEVRDERGWVVSRRATIRVDRVHRGSVPATVIREQPMAFSSCDVQASLDLGARRGFVDDDVVELVTLRRALAAYPAAAGRGQVTAAVAGRFGPATVAALDRRGSVVAYGFGGPRGGTLAACPGRERLVQAGDGFAVRRLHDMAIVRETTLRRRAVAVACLDRWGSAAALLRAPGGVELVVVRRGAVTRPMSGTFAQGALGHDGAVLADRDGALTRVGYAGGLAVGARLPAGVLDVAVSRDLTRVAAIRLRRAGRVELVLSDLRAGRRIVRTLPARAADGGLPRVPESLGFDRAGRVLLGHRGRLLRLDRSLRPLRVLARAERHAALGRSGAWAIDARGRLHRGRERLGALPRRDAGPVVALDDVRIDAPASVPPVL